MIFRNLLFIFILTSAGLMAQIDKNNAIRIKGMDFKLDTLSEKTQPKYDFSLKIPSTLKFSDKADPNPDNKKLSFIKQSDYDVSSSIMNQRSSYTDKDVKRIKYFNGKDMTNPKMTTSRGQELGKVSTTSKKLRIECRDHSFVDGDRVRVYLNKRIIYRTVSLVGSYFTINIDLDEGFNRIDIEALNQGSSGPNTAEFIVIDQTGNVIAQKEWNMLTGNIATLVVIKN
ncbi:MAG: hypothetical protein DSY82_07705 [Flavobacteriia bacterium]|nr:MAG: hypothetical protein DSY82_07705 [Flavobacteriia bacterium]